MKIKAYVDTNIIIYAVLHNPKLGKKCEDILFDIEDGKIIGYGSYFVAIELLGSLARLDPNLALEATRDYLSMNMNFLEINDLTIEIAGIINTITNVKYDAIHLALMLINNLDTIITNDLDDWLNISRNMHKISKSLREKGYEIKIKKINVIPPEKYKQK